MSACSLSIKSELNKKRKNKDFIYLKKMFALSSISYENLFILPY